MVLVTKQLCVVLQIAYGVPPEGQADTDNVQPPGDEVSVFTAAAEGQLKELKHVIDSLVEHEHVQALMSDCFGNHTIQHLVIASSKLRRAGVSSLQRAHLRTFDKVKCSPTLCIQQLVLLLLTSFSRAE